MTRTATSRTSSYKSMKGNKCVKMEKRSLPLTVGTTVIAKDIFFSCPVRNVFNRYVQLTLLQVRRRSSSATTILERVKQVIYIMRRCSLICVQTMREISLLHLTIYFSLTDASINSVVLRCAIVLTILTKFYSCLLLNCRVGPTSNFSARFVQLFGCSFFSSLLPVVYDYPVRRASLNGIISPYGAFSFAFKQHL